MYCNTFDIERKGRNVVLLVHCGCDMQRCAMMHQMKMLSTKRFGSRIASMSELDFKELKNAVGKFYNIF
jgi:mRNA-degrading endonuclease toxin of MazEF toxin-antitoxin module